MKTTSPVREIFSCGGGPAATFTLKEQKLVLPAASRAVTVTVLVPTETRSYHLPFSCDQRIERLFVVELGIGHTQPFLKVVIWNNSAQTSDPFVKCQLIL